MAVGRCMYLVRACCQGLVPLCRIQVSLGSPPPPRHPSSQLPHTLVWLCFHVAPGLPGRKLCVIAVSKVSRPLLLPSLAPPPTQKSASGLLAVRPDCRLETPHRAPGLLSGRWHNGGGGLDADADVRASIPQPYSPTEPHHTYMPTYLHTDQRHPSYVILLFPSCVLTPTYPRRDPAQTDSNAASLVYY